MSFPLKRTLGLLSPLGGSSLRYYLCALEREVRRRSGPEQAARLIALGSNQGATLLADEKWWTLVQHVRSHVRDLARGGAEAFILGSLAWYRFADEISEFAPIPLLHPIDALIKEILRSGESRPVVFGIIGHSLATYPGPLRDRLASHGTVLVPRASDAAALARILEHTEPGTASPAPARAELLQTIRNLRRAGATLIVIGEPEFAELLTPDDARDCAILPEIQVAAAVDWMLARAPEALS